MNSTTVNHANPLYIFAAIIGMSGLIGCDLESEDLDSDLMQSSDVEAYDSGVTAEDTGALPADGALVDRIEIGEQEPQIPVQLTGPPYKVCSVWVPGRWRDSIIVPSTWTFSTCNDYRIDVGASSYALGCIFDTKHKFGAGGANAPNNNCGW